MPETSFDLSVIIVNWNTGQLLSDCLKALLEEVKDLKSQIIVVDNHSSDDSIPVAKQLFPKVHYIINSFNGGFAKANNQGLQSATGKYILFLNPDTQVQKDSIHQLIQFMEQNPRAGIVGGRLIYPDGEPQYSHFGFPAPVTFKRIVEQEYLTPGKGSNPWQAGEYRFARLLQKWNILSSPVPVYEDLELNIPVPLQIDYPVGACFLVGKEVVEQLKGFDERFFLYCEEADFCYRAKQNGWKVYSIPQATIIHYGGASSSKISDKRFQIWAKSQCRYIRKYYGWVPALKVRFLLNRFPRVFMKFNDSMYRGEKKD